MVARNAVGRWARVERKSRGDSQVWSLESFTERVTSRRVEWRGEEPRQESESSDGRRYVGSRRPEDVIGACWGTGEQIATEHAPRRHECGEANPLK